MKPIQAHGAAAAEATLIAVWSHMTALPILAERMTVMVNLLRIKERQVRKDSYMGGEQVKIDMKITASTSSDICYHLGASMGASITAVNKDDPFVNYGTDTDLREVAENPQRGSIATEKNDTNTGYRGDSITVGGEMPSGYENGDKVYIFIWFGGGNNIIKTAYEYEWVRK